MVSIATIPAFPCNNTRSFSRHILTRRSAPPSYSAGTWRSTPITSKLKEKTALEYRKLGDSDLNISEITLGTVFQKWVLFFYSCFWFFTFGNWIRLLYILQMTFGEQNSEKEAHEMLSYAFEHGINALDTAEAVSGFFFGLPLYAPNIWFIFFSSLCNVWYLISFAIIRPLQWTFLFLFFVFIRVSLWVRISCVFSLECFTHIDLFKIKGRLYSLPVGGVRVIASSKDAIQFLLFGENSMLPNYWYLNKYFLLFVSFFLGSFCNFDLWGTEML